MKRILLSLLTVVVLGCLGAGAEEFVLGGCNHKIMTGSGYGSDNAGHISAAMYIPGSKLKSLAGNRISRVDVGLVSRINVHNLNVWVRKSLDGENLALEVVERPSMGWNEVSFSSPYTIEQNTDGLYVGYDYENAGSSHPVSFMGNGDEYPSYLKIGGGKWEDMSSRGALSVEAVVTGNNLPQYDLALLSGRVFPDISAGNGAYTVTGEVSNLALKDVSGFNLLISSNGEKAAEIHVNSNVARGAKAVFTAGFTSEIPLADEVSLLISSVDGGSDADMSNNSATAKVAFQKNVVVEEFTTERCSNCPEPGKWFSNVLESDPLFRTRVVPVCHHSAFGTDWLTRDCDTELLWLFDMNGQSFAPAAMFNRHAAFRKGLYMDKFEPIVALRSQKDFEECIRAELEEEAHAMVGLRMTDFRDTEAGREIDVRVAVATDDAFSLSNPILVFYALEDNLQAFRQEGATGTYYHHHVIRFDNGNYGEPVAFSDNRFEKTFTVTLSPDWKMEKMYFAAFIANYDPSDVGNNAVENSAVLYFTDTPAGVASGLVADPAAEVCRYDVHGVRHSAPFSGLNIILFSDGSIKKVFVKN